MRRNAATAPQGTNTERKISIRADTDCDDCVWALKTVYESPSRGRTGRPSPSVAGRRVDRGPAPAAGRARVVLGGL